MAAIAMISTGALAVGVIVLSLSTGMTSDVNNYLFGSMLAMSGEDVTLSVVLAAAVLMLFVLFYRRIFAVTFDETFARATGWTGGGLQHAPGPAHRRDHRTGHAGNGHHADLQPDHLPGADRHARMPQLQKRDAVRRGGIGGMLLCGAVRKLPAFHRRRSHGGRGQHSGVPGSLPP